MNALVIGANEDSIESMQIARKYGYTIYAIDGSRNAKGLEAADYSYVVDINDLSAVFEITDRIQPNIVLPAPIGHCLTTVGAVNDRYGLLGVSEKSAKACTDKYLFNDLLEKKHLRNAKTLLIKKGEKSEDVLNHIDFFPIVVKPRTGSGSRSIEVINKKEELSLWAKRHSFFEEDYTLERFVIGDEYGIDGAFVNGKFYLVLLRKKINTPLPYRQCVGYISVQPGEEQVFFDRCTSCMEKVGTELGFENCVIHADIIKSKDDEPFVIETSARPSGHNLSNYFTPRVTGIVLVDEFVKSVMQKPFSDVPTKTEKKMIRFFDLPTGIVVQVPQKDEILSIGGVEDYCCYISEGDYLREVTDGASVMGRGYYLISANKEEDLLEIDKQIRDGFIIKKQ